VTAALNIVTQVQAASIFDRCQKDPEFFVKEILGDDPWNTQVKILESVRDNRVTSVPSCHSSGKSWTAGRIALWFGTCHPGAKVITTAPTERQVKGVLWGEIHRAASSSKVPLGGDATAMQLKFAPDHWIWGFTAPDWDESRFQGFHAPHILVVVDEASGISAALMDQIDSLLAGGHARKLLIGNPIVSGCSFERDCNSSAVNTISIAAWDTPNFLAFGITEEDMLSGAWQEKCGDAEMPHPELITPAWVAERLEIWGVDSNAWQTRIRGEFPRIVEGAYYGELMKKAREEGRVGSFPYDPQYPVTTAWDIGMKDATSIWFFQQMGARVHLIDYYEATGQGLPHYVKVLQEKPYVYREHIAPHDMKVREWTPGVARTSVAQELGINFRVLEKVVVKLGSELAEGVDAVRRVLPRCYFDVDGAGDGIACLDHYRRKRNRSTGELTDIPDHGWASHGADAFRYLALGIRQVSKIARPKNNTRWMT
jgi:hypothetical protein